VRQRGTQLEVDVSTHRDGVADRHEFHDSGMAAVPRWQAHRIAAGHILCDWASGSSSCVRQRRVASANRRCRFSSLIAVGMSCGRGPS
jgi:hypothetical protein